jgi:hypothetical protein
MSVNTRPRSTIAAIIAASMLMTSCAGGGSNDGADSGSPPGSGTPPAATYSIGGSINGNPSTVELSLNGVPQLFSGVAFVFTQQVPSGGAYVVTVRSPTGAACGVQQGTGNATADVRNVQVTCAASTSLVRALAAQIIGTMGVGDYDGDGQRDIAFTIRTLDTHPAGGNRYFVRFLHGQGDGTFRAPVDVVTYCSRVGLAGGRTTISRDFDRDGVDDYVCTGPDTGLQMFHGVRGGIPVATFNSGGRDVGNLAAADLSGDGYPEIIDLVSYSGSLLNPFAYYANLQGAGFAPIQYFGGRSVGTYGSAAFQAADFTGDGAVDLLTITGNCSQPCAALGLFSSAGPGQLVVPTTFNAVPTSTFAGTLAAEAHWAMGNGDVDGNGTRDVALTSSTNFVQVMLNDGAGRFSAGDAVVVGNRPVRVLLSDVDQDSIADIISADADSRTVTVAFGLGGGHFGSSTTPGNRWKQIALDPRANFLEFDLVDLDNNGFPDIVLAENGMPGANGFGLGSVIVLRNVGM